MTWGYDWSSSSGVVLFVGYLVLRVSPFVSSCFNLLKQYIKLELASCFVL